MVSQVSTATVSWLTATCGSIPPLKETFHFVVGAGERMPTRLSMASKDGMSLSSPRTISFTSSRSNTRSGTGSLPPSNGPTNATGALRPGTGTGLCRGFRSARSMGHNIAMGNASSEETSFVMAHLCLPFQFGRKSAYKVHVFSRLCTTSKASSGFLHGFITLLWLTPSVHGQPKDAERRGSWRGSREHLDRAAGLGRVSLGDPRHRLFGLPAPTGEHRHRPPAAPRSEEHTSALQSRENLVCRLLLDKKKTYIKHLMTPIFDCAYLVLVAASESY